MAFYSVRASKENMASFHKKEKGQLLAKFESRYSNVKAWTTRFFFINGRGWEFPKTEEVLRDFSVRVIWAAIPIDKSV